MHRNLIAAAAAALFAGSALAQSSVTLSGIMDAAARSASNEGLGSVKSLVSGSNATSRLVVRGVEDLGGGLRAGFHLEHGIAVDTGNPTGGFWDRRSTVSLMGSGWGEVRLGRDFVPTYLAWNRFDVFGYVGVAGSNNMISNTPVGPLRSTWGTAANTTVRASNAIHYFLPGGLGGFEGQLMVSAAEGSAAADTKTISGRAGWSGGGFAVAFGHSVVETIATTASKFKDTAVGASYNFGPGRVNVAWRKFEQGSAEQTNLMVSSIVDVGAHQLKATVLQADLSGRVGSTNIDANDATLMGVGYVYSLSKRSALYASYSRIDNDGAATFTVPGGPAGIAGGKLSRGYEFGLRHNF